MILCDVNFLAPARFQQRENLVSTAAVLEAVHAGAI